MDAILCWFEQHPGTASWVQAAGVIVSLLGAILVAMYQNNLQRKLTAQQKRREIHQRLASVVGISEFALDLIEDAEGMWATTEGDRRQYFSFVYDAHAFDRTLKAFNEVPVHELPDNETIKMTMNLAWCFERIFQVLKDEERVGHSDETRERHAISEFQTFACVVGDSNVKLKQLMKAWEQ
jgi:hypothetical protein